MILWAYQIIYPLVAVGVLFHLIFSGRGKILNEGRADILERLGLPSREAVAGLAGGRVLWLHAASVGEVIAAGPIIKQITSSRPDLRLLLTTSTVAGRSRGKSIPEVTACVLLPIDFYPAIAAFLRRIRPNALLLVEKEFWPMMLKAVTNRMIPCGIVNGRITAKSAKRYALLSGIFRPLLGKIDRAAVQTDEDKSRFIALGIRESAVAVTGNSKYDTPKTSPEAQKKIKERLAALGWDDAVVFVAGSTRKGEEEIILEAFLSVNRKDPRLKLILAPRHLERIDEVASVLRGKGVRFLPWSEPLQSESAPDCVLLDEMGLLADIYSIGSFAFVSMFQ